MGLNRAIGENELHYFFDKILNIIDTFILKKAAQNNVERKVNEFVNVQKLKGLTRNSSVPQALTKIHLSTFHLTNCLKVTFS